MDDKITYEVKAIADIEPALLRDLRYDGKTHGIIRTSPTSVKAWSFHTSEKAALAAARRWRSRDVVTR